MNPTDLAKLKEQSERFRQERDRATDELREHREHRRLNWDLYVATNRHVQLLQDELKQARKQLVERPVFIIGELSAKYCEEKIKEVAKEKIKLEEQTSNRFIATGLIAAAALLIGMGF